MKNYIYVAVALLLGITGYCLAQSSLVTEIPPKPLKTKNNWEEFQQTAVLSALLDQCDTISEVKEKKEVWQKFSKDYATYLIVKNKFSTSQVTKLVADALYQIDEKYGDEIPETICSNALSMMLEMKKQWDSKLDKSENKDKFKQKYQVKGLKENLISSSQ